MRGEWTCRRAAIQWLKNWGFHFEEVMLIKECPQGLDKLGAFAEGIADFRIHCQIRIALAGTQFYVIERCITDNRAIFLSHIFISGER